jgi:DNA-binding NtrC family response regulator
VDLVLLDFQRPDGDGLSVLRHVKEKSTDTIVILMTAYSSVPNAVEAMKLGAFHYVNKPFDVDEIVLLPEKALETARPDERYGRYAAISGMLTALTPSSATSASRFCP